MNVLTIFEQRIGAIFEEGAPGTKQPFSFKRLAKRMVREMEDATFVIDGVDTAPALYTVLVSQADDYVMRPLYIQITDEISQLIEAQAKKRGYTFVGRPLVRFMVDPGLRNGRFSVFAENIDPRTLARLRDEENAYLGIASAPRSQAKPSYVAPREPEPAPEVIYAPPADPEIEAMASGAAEAGFDDFEDDSLDELAPNKVAYRDLPETDMADGLDVPADINPACTLINLETGEAFHIEATDAIIGRERTPGTIVLHDPNVSRRHAELMWADGGWYIRDLGSTNGTIVNNAEIDSVMLSEGDILTIGITNLEFRAG